MIVRPIDPVTSIVLTVPQEVIAVARIVVQTRLVRPMFVVPVSRGTCYVCGRPARVAIRDADLRHPDEAFVELCAGCVGRD